MQTLPIKKYVLWRYETSNNKKFEWPVKGNIYDLPGFELSREPENISSSWGFEQVADSKWLRKIFKGNRLEFKLARSLS